MGLIVFFCIFFTVVITFITIASWLCASIAKGMIKCECDMREFTDIMGPVTLTQKGREKLEGGNARQ